MPDANASPESKVLINGVEIPPDIRVDVLETLVAQNVEGGDMFDLTVNTLDSDALRLKWIDASEFAPGNAVEIQVGYRGSLTSLLVGEITALAVKYDAQQAAVLHVQGFDRLHRLRRGRKTRAFNGVKDSQVAETIANELGLTPQVQDTSIVHPYLLQNNLSDIDFLLMRARRIRYEVLITGQKLVFREAANNQGQTLSLEYQKDLKWFHPRLSTASLASELTVRGWNPATKEAILGVGRAGDETSKMGGQKVGPAIVDASFGKTSEAVVEIPIASQAEADQMAKAMFNDMALGLICGEGEAVGNTSLKAGITISLLGLGDRFNGVYYVRQAEHRIGPKVGYVTKFNVVRNTS
jgi:phage protein D